MAGLGIVFDTLKLIACEYNAHTLSTYFGREAPLLLPFVICVLLHHACSVGLLHLFSSVLSALVFRSSACFVDLYNCISLNFCYLVCLNVGSVMDASKRMVLAKALKAARATKAGASSAPAADPNLSLTLPSPTPTTTEAPLGSSSPPPRSPQPLQTPSSPPPIAAVPLAVASSPAPTPQDIGKRVLEILSDDEDPDGVVSFKRRKAARVPSLPTTSLPGGDSLRDNPPSATSPPPTIV